MLWLVLANIAIYAWQAISPPEAAQMLIFRWGLSSAGLEEGRIWQFLTHAFLHGNIWHLAVNVLSLWFAGLAVESQIGKLHFLLLYALSAVGGGIGQLLIGPPGIELIGASGAVCGVLLAFATVYHDREILVLVFFVLPIRLRAKYLGWAIIVVSLVAIIFQLEPWIGHAAHLGGAVTGYLFARAMGYGPRTWPERLIFGSR
ncbi:MAG: hypothetical protein Fur0032_13990 [Terrimicrobiaceae bacterium]